MPRSSAGTADGRPNPDPAEAAAPLPFAVWAEASARLNRIPEQARTPILEALKLEPRRFTDANRFWTRVLVEEIGAAHLDRAQRLAEAYVREQARLASAPAPAKVETPAAAAEEGGAASTPRGARGGVRGTMIFEDGARRATDEPRAGSSPSDHRGEARTRALPFVPAPAAVPMPGPVGAAPRRTGITGPSTTTGTIDVSAAMSKLRAPGEAPVLPFGKPAPEPRAPEARFELDVAAYASLCAELAAAPSDRDAIARRYGLSSADVERTHARFGHLFQRDRAAAAAYRDHMARYERFTGVRPA